MDEYLENVCTHRYLKRNQVEENSQEVPEMVQENTPEVEVVEVKEMVEEEEEKLAETKSEQEMRIRAILEEFLA